VAHDDCQDVGLKMQASARWSFISISKLGSTKKTEMSRIFQSRLLHRKMIIMFAAVWSNYRFQGKANKIYACHGEGFFHIFFITILF